MHSGDPTRTSGTSSDYTTDSSLSGGNNSTSLSAGDALSSAQDKIQSTGSQLRDQATQTASQIRDQGRDLLNQTQDTAKTHLSTQKDALSGTLSGAADAVRQMGSSLRQQGQTTAPLGQYTETVAHQLDRASSYLSNRDVTEIVADVEQLARRQPALFIGGAFALGLLAARFLKSGNQ